MISHCPHCGREVDFLELVYANARAREAERETRQEEFDRTPPAALEGPTASRRNQVAPHPHRRASDRS